MGVLDVTTDCATGSQRDKISAEIVAEGLLVQEELARKAIFDIGLDCCRNMGPVTVSL